jgi:hypothetical protein
LVADRGFPRGHPSAEARMATEAAEVGIEVEALINDLGAARTAEMDVAGDLAEAVSDRE